ncbi:DUF2537 domain-containing protein [Aldersonia kunmingensis]|uniref:DUF2537 domain-containing protein n=1 Tax=Aldersonia kunmingensis TaxID=408066 RepID=UPI00082FB427|nr:DUF2537 domain-containing protein [Aldersonia kunmingensis]
MTEPAPEQTESTPWTTGLLVSAIVTALVATGIYAFGAALADINPILAVVINIVAVGGAAPSVWRWHTVAVWRWVVYGAIAGVALGWLGLLASAI